MFFQKINNALNAGVVSKKEVRVDVNWYREWNLEIFHVFYG